MDVKNPASSVRISGSASSHDFTVSHRNGKKMNERRSGHRWDVVLDAIWDGTSGNYTARITDLSDGGCYMDSLGDVSLGEPVNLKLQLPGGEWLELSGEVAHHTPPVGFGVRFLDLSEDQLKRLRAFIEYLNDPNSSELRK
jgi:hypothetical protein